MLDHVSITVSDIPAAERFYDAIIKALEIVKVGRRDDWLGSGERARAAHPDRVYRTIRKGAKPDEAYGRHGCFKAKSRAQVDAYWHAGVSAGGTDEGRPGPRDYHASYYGAFLPDPDGNRVEAVCHLAPGLMRAGQPSQMARGAAAYRAIHQRLDGGAIFRDPYASRILDAETLATLDEMAADPSLTPMRLFIAARSRFSEDTLAACVAHGARQVVVLGAGLDTFSLRNPYAGQGVRVFEVDFPATQQWKRQQLAQASLAVPSSLTFAPVDFERQSLSDGLAQVGFRVDRPAFFQWLGVVPYLTREAISQTLEFIAGIPEAEVVFDYAEPFENYPADRRVHVMGVAGRAAARGEPWLSLFDPPELSKLLRDNGFGTIEDLGLAELSDRYYGALKEGIPIGPGGHVVRARMT